MAWKFWKKDEAEYRSTLANPSDDLLEAFGTSRSWSGERVTTEQALGMSAVFSAVEQISEAVGSRCPLKVYRVMDDDERVEARGHRSYRMLHDKPNDYTIAPVFWSTVTALLLLNGNAFLLKERDQDTDTVEQLWLIDPSEVTIEWNGREKRYIHQPLDGRRKRVYTDEQLLHIMGFSLDGMVGISRIAYCRQTLGTAIGRARFEGEFYSNGARIPGVIEHPGRLGQQGVQNLASGFRDVHTGKGNRHKVPVLEEGAAFKQIGMSLLDMQFVENAQMSRSDIATMFNLPASYLNASTGDSLTYATTESNAIQFANQAVAPLTTRIARALSADPSILPWNVMYAEFVLEGLMRADMKTRVEYWKALKDMGVVDADYIASRENLPKPPPEKKVAPPVAPPNQLELPQIPQLKVAGSG